MRTDCISYGDCDVSMECDAFCKFYNKTCMDCGSRCDDDCGHYSHMIVDDFKPCARFYQE